MDIKRSEQYKRWLKEHQRIQNAKWISSESNENQNTRIKKAQKSYNYFIQTYFTEIARKPCGKFQLDAAKYIRKNKNTRAVFEWARGHAKSTHLGVLIPLWLKIQEDRQFNTMVLVGKSEESAIRLLADLQHQLANNELFIHDFGPQMKSGNWAEGMFTTVDNYNFIALGRGQSPRGLKKNGYRPDYIVIDDIDDDEMVRNPKRVNNAVEWVLTALFGTMDAGRGRFIMVGNRIAKTSVLTQIIERPGVHHTVVNVLDKKGEPTWYQNYTKTEIEELRQMMGERNFQKEYMNNPLTEGAVFSSKYMNYTKIQPLKNYKQLICYTDPSFKNSNNADYKATVLIGKTSNGVYHVLKVFADQTSVSNMVRWHYDIEMYVNGAVPVMYYMEANFMQDLMLEEFRKEGDTLGHQIPIRGDNRKKPEKFARIEALQPLFERSLIMFNQDEKDSNGMRVLIEQLLLFERGSKTHDDAPDALEGAIWILTQRTRNAKAKYVINKRPSRRW